MIRSGFVKRCWFAPWLFALGCSASKPVDVCFRAVVGDRPMLRGASYADVGTPGGTVRFSALRMYISRPRLFDAQGRDLPLALQPNGSQNEHLALLDLASGHDRSAQRLLRGRAPAGRAAGIAFELGVPFAENHGDVSSARAPLDVSSMFWVWRSGYKFLRLEAKTQAPEGERPLSVHLGSTGCTALAPTDAPERCTRPNRVPVRLRGFDPARDTIDFDLAALLASMALPADDARDCESSPDDADCAGVFDALGLRGRHAQRVFRVGKGMR